MKTITLQGEPKSTQTCYKHICRGKFSTVYMDKKCKDIKEIYTYEARQQWDRDIIKGDIKLNIRLFFGTKRVSDWDNFNKLFTDSLTGIVWVDDSQIQQAHVSKHFDKSRPRIEIDIEEMVDL